LIIGEHVNDLVKVDLVKLWEFWCYVL